MRLITESLLRERAQGRSSLNENISNNAFAHQFLDTNFDIFLSHSYPDKGIINSIYNELTSLGLSVYVDWIVDPQLDRNNVTRDSAELIRTRMNHSSSLIYCISANAAMSNWMPWELGYVDGHSHKCAVLPIAKTNIEKYNRREYLKLYPFITESDISKNFVVRESESSIRGTLNEWIK